MKRNLVLISGLLSSLIFARPVFAVAGDSVDICPTGTFSVLCKLQFNNISSLIGNILTFLLIIAVIVSIVFLIFGGIKWIISGGDKAAVEGARNTIVAAIIGLIVSLLAFFILRFVLGLFGIEITNFTFPRLIQP